jgi:hypothetical protein
MYLDPGKALADSEYDKVRTRRFDPALFHEIAHTRLGSSVSPA